MKSTQMMPNEFAAQAADYDYEREEAEDYDPHIRTAVTSLSAPTR